MMIFSGVAALNIPYWDFSKDTFNILCFNGLWIKGRWV